MFREIRTLYRLLSRNQRKNLLRLQILVILMSFAELLGVVSIGPFMAVVGDVSYLEGDGILAQIYQASGFSTPQQFLFWLGIAVLLTLSAATALSMFTLWRMSVFGAQIGAELSTRLYKYYMQQVWLFHANNSSSQLINRVSHESDRVTKQIIQPLMLMNGKGILALFMSAGIFLLNPYVAVTGMVVLGGAYLLLYRVVRRRLARNGDMISRASRQRFKLMNEGFGGIKDTLLLGRQADFNRRFEQASQLSGYAQGSSKALSQVPRYLMELVAFGGVMLLVLYLLRKYEGDMGSILPVLSVYALAGFKLLPAFQQIYASLTQVKANLAAFESLEQDLVDSQDLRSDEGEQSASKLSVRKLIELDDIHFSYLDKEEKALQGLSLQIPVNQVIGLVGASGSGKSTAIDVLLGLITPQHGTFKVDGQELKEGKMRAWQNNVGFVSQAIFLSDASIKENIAFGVPPDQIDMQRIRKAASMARLDELLERLPEGLETRVGERGVQLSGGQRQRIGIARALYDDAEVLVLDEATSALDGITEKQVMDAIHYLSGKKTIVIIAHRLATVQACNIIYLLDNGRVIDQGSYQELIGRSPLFQRMAAHT